MSFYTILLLILGVVLVVAGSNYLVDGASDIARRSGLSEFVIGLTIVGIGTSTPEMVVSFLSSWRGNADMSVGNIVGSNIFNTYLILGITAVILPMAITAENIRRDIPLNILAATLLVCLGMNKFLFGIGENELSRLDGAIMLVCFALYLYSCFRYGASHPSEPEEEIKHYKSVAVPIVMVIGGLAALIFGGRMFVDNATVLARHFGWSDKFIAITILAGGTSLPELATCVVAAFKKKGQLALGNIIGSNISNILLILGGSALIHPLRLSGINPVDMGFVLLSTLFLLAAYFTFDKHKLDRTEGIALLALEGVYAYLLISAL